jgi:hypothetical protein
VDFLIDPCHHGAVAAAAAGTPPLQRRYETHALLGFALLLSV